METLQPVESMTDDEVLATFGTSEDPEHQGFDEITHTRVIAAELVRARNRLAYYRTLYAAFIGAIPAKLVFTDVADHVLAIGDQPEVVIWTEPVLLDALAQERAVHDFFTALLDELEPALQEP
jgi:hypothetical protein